MKKSRLFPFSWMPGSWGLKGAAFKEAEASYYYEGEDLDRELAKIRFSGDEPRLRQENLWLDKKYGKLDDYGYEHAVAEYSEEGKKLALKKLAIDLKYQKISSYDYETQVTELRYSTDARQRQIAQLAVDLKYEKLTEYEHDVEIVKLKHEKGSADLKLACLDIDFKHSKITEIQYEKEKATLLDEPWVGILESGFDSDKGISGLYFTLDWNRQWIDKLITAGYSGATEQDVIDQWFNDVCRSQGLDAAFGEGNVVPFQF